MKCEREKARMTHDSQVLAWAALRDGKTADKAGEEEQVRGVVGTGTGSGVRKDNYYKSKRRFL